MTHVSGARVLVTGAGGFIGSHLVERLVADGAEVRALLRYTSRRDRGALEWIDPAIADSVEVLFGDVRSAEPMRDAVAGCDFVFHLAASISIPHSYEDPRGVVETNLLGTLNIAEACRREGVKRLIHTSTSEVYGSAQTVPITEDHPLSAQSPYAASKMAADQLVISYHRSFELPACVLRPFNTFGPRQSGRAVIPTIISQALVGGPVRLGSLDPRRDFTHVSDTVTGFVDVAGSAEAIGETLQLGTGYDISIGDLVAEIGEVIGTELEIEQEEERVRPPSSEVERLISSPQRMTELTGWRPQRSLRDGLAETVEWIRAHPEQYRISEYMR